MVNEGNEITTAEMLHGPADVNRTHCVFQKDFTTEVVMKVRTGETARNTTDKIRLGVAQKGR